MANDDKPGLIDRTLMQLRDAWRDVAASTRVAMTGSVRPDLPEAVVAVIDKCLEKEPENRYPRAREAAAEIRRALDAVRAAGGSAAPGGDASAAANVDSTVPIGRNPAPADSPKADDGGS